MIAKCNNCGEESPDFNASDPEDQPCPRCGSLEKTVSVFFEEKVKRPKVQLGFKVKEVGKKKPIREHKSGDEIQNSTGEWVKKEREIDRENDKYKEKVVDPKTGKIVHHCEEALSKHIGHGSDKKKKMCSLSVFEWFNLRLMPKIVGVRPCTVA